MKEIGGYIEVEYYKGKMLYDDGVKINCGRNALEYIILAKKIKRILLFLISSYKLLIYFFIID